MPPSSFKSELGIFANICANGETWEFTATLNGNRVGRSIFRTPEDVRGPNLAETFDALRSLLNIPDAEQYGPRHR